MNYLEEAIRALFRDPDIRLYLVPEGVEVVYRGREFRTVPWLVIEQSRINPILQITQHLKGGLPRPSFALGQEPTSIS